MKTRYNRESSYKIMNFNSNITLCDSNLTQTIYSFYINQFPIVQCKAFSAVYKYRNTGLTTLTALHMCYMHYSCAHQKPRLKES